MQGFSQPCHYVLHLGPLIKKPRSLRSVLFELQFQPMQVTEQVPGSDEQITEAASLQIGDLNLRVNQIGDVQLRGKGRKMRRCPLWPATATALLALIRTRGF